MVKLAAVTQINDQVEIDTRYHEFSIRLNELFKKRGVPERGRVAFVVEGFAALRKTISSTAARRWFRGQGMPENENFRILGKVVKLSEVELAYLQGLTDTLNPKETVKPQKTVLHHSVQRKIYVNVHHAVVQLGHDDISDILDDNAQNKFYDTLFEMVAMDSQLDLSVNFIAKLINLQID